IIDDADEAAARGGDDLLARQGAATALDELEVPRGFVGPVHVQGHFVQAVQGYYGNAALAQALFRGLGTRDGALDALLHPGKEVDEEVDGAPGAYADDHVVLDQGECRLG